MDVTIHIPCPKCGRELKLRDRSLLGRKGKCPKCEHAFVLEEPEVVQLELAEPEPKAVGRWIPEAGVGSATTARPMAGRTAASSVAVPESPLPNLPNLGADDGAAARLKALQKKNASRRNTGLIVGAIVAVAVSGVTYYAITNAPRKPTPVQEQNVELGQVDPVAAPDEVAVGAANSDSEFARAGSPTKGQPIELQYIPFGAQVVINIRPAELWASQSLGEELRYCLPPIAKLMETQFQELFKRKPEEIEEAQICLIPGAQGTLPEIAAVVHLVEEAKKSQLLTDIGGERVDDYDYPVYIAGERAFLIADQKTLAVCPRSQVQEMVAAVTGRNPASDGIDELLPLTDRDRHITIVFVPRTIRLHSSWWFPENVKPFALQTCDWFGDEVESAAWSFHLGEKTFYSDLILRNVTGVTSNALERETREKLQKLPFTLLDTVRMMNPTEVGKRKVIGRVPKMAEVFALASTTSKDTRYVRVTTPLPDRGAPNLALGALLAWDESTRTDFTKERVKPSTEEIKVPDLIVDRLKMKIDVDFRRAPLQDAFAYIAGEIRTTIDIDGDALKAGGFTKNMPQTFQGDKMSALEAITKILERYQDPTKPSNTMVIVVDQEKRHILVSTKAFCEQQKLTPYDIQFK
ncbi:MAG: hypothetical protein JSS49_07770 [Planctomycetes bacterium]|nr:hypothetical protein [Planctomycetota bacterium]